VQACSPVRTQQGHHQLLQFNPSSRSVSYCLRTPVPFLGCPRSSTHVTRVASKGSAPDVSLPAPTTNFVHFSHVRAFCVTSDPLGRKSLLGTCRRSWKLQLIIHSENQLNALLSESNFTTLLVYTRVGTLTLRLLMSYIYIYIYIWSAYFWCF